MFSMQYGKPAKEMALRRATAMSPARRPPTRDNPVWHRLAIRVQPKLSVNQPRDEYEREADRVAEQVTRVPEPVRTHAIAPAQVQRMCPECEEELQRHVSVQGEMNHGIPAAPPIVEDVLRGPGEPLDPPTRHFMETRFGHDFGQVRVHVGPRAAESARAVQALAYTVGRNIVFGPGQFAPAASSGRRLLAHELAHVIQQTGGDRRPEAAAASEAIGSRQRAAAVQRACAANATESFYQSAANYCLDDVYAPATHPTMTSCYRDVPTRTATGSCPPGDQVCFDAQGNCHDSPDKASIVASRNPNGTCAFLGKTDPCYLKHVAVDGVPGIFTELIPELVEGARELIPDISMPSWPTFMQRKLTVGQPDNEFEREADRAADHVTSMPEPPLQTKPRHDAPPAFSFASPITIQREPADQENEPPEDQPTEETPSEDGGWSLSGWGEDILQSGQEWLESLKCDPAKNNPPTTPLAVNIPDIECAPQPAAFEDIVSDHRSTDQPLGVTSVKSIGTQFGPSHGSLFGYCSYTLAIAPVLEFERMLYTRANDENNENDAYSYGEEESDSGECKGKVIPRRLRITAAMAEKIRQGEIEHCEDYKLAFALTYGKYIQTFQEMVDKGLCGWDCQAEMKKYFKARTGVDFDNRGGAAVYLMDKTSLRDRRGWHSVNLYKGKKDHAEDCSSVTYTPDAAQMTDIGTTTSEELINCKNQAQP